MMDGDLPISRSHSSSQQKMFGYKRRGGDLSRCGESSDDRWLTVTGALRTAPRCGRMGADSSRP
jgi:hypothetical protein